MATDILQIGFFNVFTLEYCFEIFFEKKQQQKTGILMC
jgi:hypothetical protein